MDLEEAVSRWCAGRVPTAGREGTEAEDRRLQDADSLWGRPPAEGGRGGGMRGGERDAAGGRARSCSGQGARVSGRMRLCVKGGWGALLVDVGVFREEDEVVDFVEGPPRGSSSLDRTTTHKVPLMQV